MPDHDKADVRQSRTHARAWDSYSALAKPNAPAGQVQPAGSAVRPAPPQGGSGVPSGSDKK